MNENKNNGILKGFLVVAGVIASLAGAIAVLYTVVRKHLKFTIELCPEEGESEDCICGVCDEKDANEENEEIEISLCPEGCECDDMEHCKKATEEIE